MGMGEEWDKEAKFKALIQGLKVSLDKGITKLLIEDSMLVTKLPRSKRKNYCRNNLLKETKKLIRWIGVLKVGYIPRAMSKDDNLTAEHPIDN
jgi:hypothetical protein